MVRASLTALAVWLAVASVRADERVILPTCATAPTAPLDGELLRDLLELEVGEHVVRIELGDGICTRDLVEVRTVIEGGDETRAVLPFPEETEARLAARSLSLAIAERLRVRGPEEMPSSEHDPAVAAPMEAGSALSAPRSARLPDPPPDTSAEPAIPVDLGLAAVGRLVGSISPQRLSWLLGLRGDLGARFAPFFGLRGELLAFWSHGDGNGFSAEGSLFAGAVTLVFTPLRDVHWDISMHLRGELGALLFFGPFGIVQSQPWAQLGGALAVTGEVTDGVALTVDLGASWNALGGQFRSPLGDLLIDLSVLTLDLGAGVRFAI